MQKQNNNMTISNNGVLQVCENSEFGKLEIVMIDDKPYFPATDCARILGYKDSTNAIKHHCRWVVKHHRPHPQSPNKTIEVNFIPEGDLYRLISKSKLPTAEKFEKWVFDEVLPSIRKYGAYMTPEKIEEILFDPKLIIGLATNLMNEQNLRIELEAKNQSLIVKNEILEEKIEEDKPKVEFADCVSDSTELITVAEMAKLLHGGGIPMGQKRLFAYLRDIGLLRYNNEPYQQYVEQGLFILREISRKTAHGYKCFIQTMITGKGQRYICERLKSGMV